MDKRQRLRLGGIGLALAALALVGGGLLSHSATGWARQAAVALIWIGFVAARPIAQHMTDGRE